MVSTEFGYLVFQINVLGVEFMDDFFLDWAEKPVPFLLDAFGRRRKAWLSHENLNTCNP